MKTIEKKNSNWITAGNNVFEEYNHEKRRC
jgi:hypothetical protein